MARPDPASQLAAVDLNLLPALDALLRDASVTAAGRRIGLSQSAMSHALARLREMLGDELLVRDGRTMQRTALALRLMPAVRRLVGEVEALLMSAHEFDPKTSRRTFRIAANDYAGAVLLPLTIAAIRRQAPDVTVDVIAAHGSLSVPELVRGELDLALGTYATIPPPLQSVELLREDFVCVLRRDHPVRGRLSLQRYVDLEHVLVASPGYGPGVVDYALQAQGLQRRVVVRIPHFLVGPALVEHTDLVLTLPRRLADMLARGSLRTVTPPVALESFGVQAIWHERELFDPGLVWLRGIMQEVARAS